MSIRVYLRAAAVASNLYTYNLFTAVHGNSACYSPWDGKISFYFQAE